jgi:thymidine kinase
MFSEKTSEMNSRFRKYKIARKTFICIKYDKDFRFDGDTKENPLVMSRDGTSTPASTCGSLLSQFDEDVLKRVDIIGIDEGQFFQDIAEFAEKWANRGKIVIITLLNGTFQRNSFGDHISKLYPLAESHTKLSAVCSLCGDAADFTKRLGCSEEIILIDDAIYEARCRECYFK